MANPAIIIVCTVIIKIICFANDTIVKILENGKEIIKKMSDVKINDMVLVHNGNEKKFAKVLRNDKIEGEHEFYIIKIRDINNHNKIKELKVTGEHVMITYENKNIEEIKLILAKNLEGNEYMETEDGLYEIYDIKKEIRKEKYFLVVKGGVVYANEIFVSTICSEDKAKVMKPSMEEWNKFQKEE